jgi:hypothetical protein
MGFKSFLSAVGHAPLVVLKYLNTPQGQKTVQIGRRCCGDVARPGGGPALARALRRLLAAQQRHCRRARHGSNGSQLGAQSGTGVQKGTAVAAALSPQAQQLLKDLGYDNPTADQVFSVRGVSSGLADIVNSIPPPAAPAALDSPVANQLR